MPPLSAFDPTFGSLMAEDDGAGTNRGWLGTESAFRAVKSMHARNLIVPIVGDFAGGKALRSVAGYLAMHAARVSVFYTSNVEQYLFQNRVNVPFYENVAALPTDTSSLFIRSFPYTVSATILPRTSRSRLAQTFSTIDAVLQAHRAGALRTYGDLAALQQR
jgi:hypothetical protein